MVRAPRFDKFGTKKGAWSEDEDNKLRSFIAEYGHKNWCELPKLAGLSRCGKSCRLRWMNYLRPNIKHGNFTKQEEDVIVGLHNKFGNKWSLMATRLPGRSDNEIKNHWHTHLKHYHHQSAVVRNDETVFRIQVVGKQAEASNKAKSTEVGYSISKLKSTQLLIDEVGILVAVLSSASPSSSSSNSTSKLSSYGSSDCLVSSDEVVTPEFPDELAGTFWTEPFLLDSEVSSNDKIMFSPLGSTNDFISDQDNIGHDVPLWSTMDSYF